MNSARRSYRAVRGAYRKARAFRNHILNFVDAPVVVLLYHRVADLPSDPEMIAVSPENFRRHMEFLKERHRILRFEEDWAALKDPAVAITFDDGYADNLLEALPILEETGVPATFFVSTGHLGTGRVFWWHRLEAVLLRDGDFPPRFTLKDSRHGRTWETASRGERETLYRSLSQLMRKVDADRRQDWLDQLGIWSPCEDKIEEIHRSLTEEELKRLSRSRWATIGAHTISHSALSVLTEEQQRSEVFSSRLTLEELTGMDITTFSYPFGRRKEYDRTSIRLCREAGFRKAASNFPGQVHRWTDPYQIPRHLVRNWDVETFAAEMKSFWTR